MEPLWWHPYLAIAVTVLVFAGLQLRRGAPADLLFLGGLMVVTVAGLLTPEEALSGFSNPAVLSVAGLLVVSAGLRSSGLLDWLGNRLLGVVHTEKGALSRLAMALVASSAFLLNTAVVAMMAPVVVDWCRRRQISPSRLLIPVSYLAILGGVCTLIGTSTTLVVNAELRNHYQIHTAAAEANDDSALARRHRDFAEKVEPMGLFEIGQVGLPCALIGAAFVILAAPRLLPNRTDMIEQLGEQRREYLVEMRVQPGCPLIGKTIEEAGLRHLPGLFLIEIDRRGEVITPVSPQDHLQADDRMIFTGVVSTIVDLERIPGLTPAADTTYEISPQAQQQRHLTEVVLSRTSPLIGSTIREGSFRRRYGAAVVAVHRNGVRLTNKVGAIRLEPGDTLLLQTRDDFVTTYRNSRDFYLVSSVEGEAPRRHDRMPIAAASIVILVILMSLSGFLRDHPWLGGLGSPAVAAITVATLMVLTRCLSISEARAAIDLQVVFTIAGALGLGMALTKSGAAESIAHYLVSLAPDNPYVLLIIIYLLAAFFTELVTNIAVAAMLLPLAIAVAWQAGYNPRPFIMAISLAASLAFVTPVGYQTNLMVMGPGGYRPADFVRVGLPLAMVVMATALALIPMVWPFG